MSSRDTRRSSNQATSPPPTTKQYPTASSSSSAFSASANPDEDWTKISDLAERRRIQNRIAQRNYRKKLKRRLEDLERRAESSSASPEQRHQELESYEAETTESHAQDYEPQYGQHLYLGGVVPNYTTSVDDRSMFSQQNTRQLSTSPPPFSATPYHHFDATAYPQCMSSPYLQHQHQTSFADQYQTLGQPAVKSEFYAEDSASPYNMSYAPLANGEYPRQNSAGESGYASSTDAYTTTTFSAAHSTLDFYDHSSPPDLVWLPATPPLSSCCEGDECHDKDSNERRMSAFVW